MAKKKNAKNNKNKKNNTNITKNNTASNSSKNGENQNRKDEISMNHQQQIKQQIKQEISSSDGILKKVCMILNRVCAIVFFIAITMFMPFYYENKYFNMLQAKGHVIQFLICTLLPVFMIFFAVWALVSVWQTKKVKTCYDGKRSRTPSQNVTVSKNYWLSFHKKSWNYMDMALALFGTVTLISYVQCKDQATSLWGMNVWCVGAAVLIGLVLFYFATSRALYLTEYMWIPVGIVNGVIFLMGIYHSAGVDVLGMHERIVEKQFYDYISTIGNVNWFSGYLCLLVPLLVVLFMNSKKIILTIFYFVISFLAMVNIVLCASDSVFAGIGICLFFIVPYMFGEAQRLRRIMLVLVSYGIALLMVNDLPCFAEKKAKMNGIAAQVLSHSVSVSIVIIGILVYIAASLWWKNLSEKAIRNIVLTIEGIMLLIILGMILYNISIFSDKWGTKRGLIWKESIRVFNNFDLKNKLIGIGPEMMGYCYKGIRDKFTYQVLSSHSEFLQFLLSVGILGVLSWMGMWIGLIVEYFRKKIWKTEQIILFLPLAAYFGQSFFNTPMALTISMLFIMLSCYRNQNMKNVENDR